MNMHMRLTKKSEILSLLQIFGTGTNSFEIPDYQRAYSWEESQRKDLMTDIENVIQLSNYRHFAGTIVAQEKESKKTIKEFYVVDGQQRLTSLVIVLSVLAQSELLSEEENREINENYLFKGKDTGNTVRLFKLNGDLDKYFYRKLEKWGYTSEEHTTKAHTNIDNAFNEFSKWLEDKAKNNKDFPSQVYTVITQKIGFLFHVPETSAEVGLMFEVINNRGKKLSELEKIKNYLIYYSEKSGYSDIAVAVEDNWGKILYNLNACGQTSNEEEDSFLRFTWIVFEQTNKSESYYVYDNLKQRFPAKPGSDWRRLKRYIEFIGEAAETYHKLLTRNLIESKDEKKIVEQIFFQSSTASILPLLLSIYSRIKNTKERLEILSIVEKLNFRYYGCGIATRSDTGNGFLFGAAHDFFNDSNYSVESLKTRLLNFIEENCNDQAFIKRLTLGKDESGDLYYWANLKYFLANYEEYIANLYGGVDDFTRFLNKLDTKSKNAHFEKEHIIAKNELSAISEIDDVNKRRLGNFVLLTPSVNKSIQDAPLYKKLLEYKKHHHKYITPRSLSELETFYGLENIDKGAMVYTRDFVVNFLDKREEALLSFAMTRWGLNGQTKWKVKIDSLTDDATVYKLQHLE
ncbi:MAG TPA: DUF262 domain-containing protein [Ohtaekwangia sp.]|nr:DUF262 domain-containing protein [Ohtaekwangia sp.]